MGLKLIDRKDRYAAQIDDERGTDFPECTFELRTPQGVATYEHLAKLLSATGTLTPETHMRLCRYCLVTDMINLCQSQGLPTRASLLNELRHAEQDLGLDKPSEAPERCPPEPPNKYAHVGFVNRRPRTS